VHAWGHEVMRSLDRTYLIELTKIIESWRPIIRAEVRGFLGQCARISCGTVLRMSHLLRIDQHKIINNLYKLLKSK